MAEHEQQSEKNAFTAEAIDPLESESTYMAKVIFAENAPGGPEAWVNLGNALMNRFKTGRFGKTLTQSMKQASSAVRNKDPQWLKADKLEFDDFESRTFNKIKDVTDAIVGGKVEDTVNGGTHWENLNHFPRPYWAKDMRAVAQDRGQDKRWNQTYFKAKPTFPPGVVETRHGPIVGEREVR